MQDGWTHIGRLWTNGEPYLAVDSAVRHLWHGFSEDEYFNRIVDLGPEETVIALGDHAAAVSGPTGWSATTAGWRSTSPRKAPSPSFRLPATTTGTPSQ